MGESTLKFERKYYIKNLFVPKQILERFEYIIFEDLKTFMYVLENDLFYPNYHKIEIYIHDKKEYHNLMSIFKGTGLNERIDFYIHLTRKSFKDIMDNIENLKYSLIVPFFTIPKYTESYIEWSKNNRIIHAVHINKNNFEQRINTICNYYIMHQMRFFSFKFDYGSFETLSVKELEKLRFWMMRLDAFRDPIKGGNVLLPMHIIKSNMFYKTIFISHDLKLYLDAKKDPIWMFDLRKHLKHTGEDIHFMELDRLLQYLYLVEKAIISDFKMHNWELVDFTQNIKQALFVNQIPMITQLIDRWLYRDPNINVKGREKK